MKRNSAFTLIELLVVIAIIALLVSILMPSLQKAKEMAKDIVCRSNQKTIGYAIFLYAEEHNAMLPYTSEPPGSAAALTWACKVGKISEDHFWGDFNPDPDALPGDPRYDWYRIATEVGYVDYEHDNVSEGPFKCPSFVGQVEPKAKWNGAVGCHFSISGTLSGQYAEYVENNEDEKPTCLMLSDIKRSGVLIGDCNINPGGGIRTSYRFRTQVNAQLQGTGRLNTMLASINRGDPPGACFGPWTQQLYIQKWQLQQPCDFPGHPGGRSNLHFTDGHVESTLLIDIDDWMIE